MTNPAPKRRIPDANMMDVATIYAGSNAEMNTWDFFRVFQRTEWATGEERLAAAVLENAINAYRHGAVIGSLSKVREAQEARAWFESKDCGYVCSFVCVCQILGIEADWWRPRILKLEVKNDRKMDRRERE